MISADPGSFRDPSSRIVTEGERVIRLLDARGLAAWKHLAKSKLRRRAEDGGQLIASELLSSPPDRAAGALEHPRLPMITYPFEWTFSMLKDAALLQLDLLSDALSEGLMIKDATPYNIQFVEGRPVFIDIGSFEKYKQGEPWIGYRQFTRQFLFPLMMRAWADVPFQPWLRGNPEGPTAAEMKSLLPFRRRATPSSFMHVSLQAKLESRLSGAAVRDSLAKAGFSAELIQANVKKLQSLVSSLEWDTGDTNWTGYVARDHVGRDREAKGTFLRDALSTAGAKRVLDLGANDGFFSEIATVAGAHAIAVDGDEGTFESVYQRSGGKDISLVLSDLSNPSPSQGWAGIERPSLSERAKPDLVIAYGLIHHLIYTSSIPPTSVLDWLREFNCPVVLEFVSPYDEMVKVLTANKHTHELHENRGQNDFRREVDARFEVRSEKPLAGGTRTLYHLVPR